jgi:hypothetical protein
MEGSSAVGAEGREKHGSVKKIGTIQTCFDLVTCLPGNPSHGQMVLKNRQLKTSLDALKIGN